MTRTSWLISKYLVRAVLPYFAFSWLLLSVILFVQQAGRFSDIFFSVNIPATLVWQLSVALVPNVISFTCPMAMLVGTVIGLAKMQTDSEIIAIRAAGIGNLQITLPIALIGLLMSVFAFVVNLEGVPLAAGIVRKVALQTAITKLESPIEPGIFNSGIGGYTIFVRDGDAEAGRWNNIFISREDTEAGTVRLITAKYGRIDFSNENSELVLEDAVISTLPIKPGFGKNVSESLGEIRLAVKTQRSEMIERLSKSGGSLNELGLAQLSDYAKSGEEKDRAEAQILWQRRLILSITPFIFSLLGAGMILRLNRGGRGLGIFLALLGLIGYYLLAFLGEQLARTGTISVTLGGLLPIAGSFLAVIWFNYSSRAGNWKIPTDSLRAITKGFRAAPEKLQLRNLFVDVTTGIRDLDLIINLTKYFLLTISFLAVVFIIFTAFDLWKFAGTIDGGIFLLVKYFFFLLPFMYLQIAPSAAMIATLATYVIKSRQNEIVTWTSAGQSVYRLLLPCFAATVLLGVLNWQIEESVLPSANQRQDEIRSLIRNRGIPQSGQRKQWIATGDRIYSFKPATPTSASDNEMRDGCPNCARDLSIYEFKKNGASLQTVFRAESGVWENGTANLQGSVERNDFREGKIETTMVNGTQISESADPFIEIYEKPSHLNIARIKDQIASSDSDVDKRNLSVGLQTKYATPFLPLIIALFTAPFALSLGRKGNVLTVGYAVGLWLLFTGTRTVFDQFGLNGYLTPQVAVWTPLVIFAMLGVYLLSKVKT